MANKIFGVARWVLDADTRKLKRAAKDAKKEIKSVGDEAGKASQKVQKGFDKSSEEIDKSSASAGAFVGKLGSMIGVASAAAGAIVLLVNAVKAVNGYFEDGAKSADRFIGSLDTVSDAEASYKKLQEQVRLVSLELEAKDAGGIASLGGRFRAQIEGDLEALRSKMVSMNKHIQRQRQKEQKETSNAFIKAVEEETRVRGFSLLPSKEAIEESANYARERFRGVSDAAGFGVDDDFVQMRLDLIDMEEKKRMDELLKRIRLQEESAREQAKEFAKQLNISTSDFTSRLDTLVRSVKQVNRTIGRR